MIFHLNEKAYSIYTGQNQKELFKKVALKRVNMEFDEAKKLFKNSSNPEFKMFSYTWSPGTPEQESVSQMTRILEFSDSAFTGSASRSLTSKAYEIGRTAGGYPPHKEF